MGMGMEPRGLAAWPGMDDPAEAARPPRPLTGRRTEPGGHVEGGAGWVWDLLAPSLRSGPCVPLGYRAELGAARTKGGSGSAGVAALSPLQNLRCGCDQRFSRPPSPALTPGLPTLQSTAGTMPFSNFLSLPSPPMVSVVHGGALLCPTLGQQEREFCSKC